MEIIICRAVVLKMEKIQLLQCTLLFYLMYKINIIETCTAADNHHFCRLPRQLKELEKIVNYRYNENLFSCETKCYHQQPYHVIGNDANYVSNPAVSHDDNTLSDIDLLGLSNEYAEWLKLQLSNLMDDRELQIHNLVQKINQQFNDNLNQFLNMEIKSYKLNDNLAEIIKLNFYKNNGRHYDSVLDLQNYNNNLKMEIVSVEQNSAINAAAERNGIEREEEIRNTINKNYFNINAMEKSPPPPQSRVIFNKNTMKIQPPLRHQTYFLKKPCYSQLNSATHMYPQSNQYHDVIAYQQQQQLEQERQHEQQQKYLTQLNEQDDQIKNIYIPYGNNYENSITYQKIMQERQFQQQPVVVPSQDQFQNIQNDNINYADQNEPFFKNYLNLKGQLSIGDFVKLNGNADLSSSSSSSSSTLMPGRNTNFRNVLRGSINTNVSVPILNSITKNVVIKKENPLKPFIPFNIFKQ